MWALRPLVVRGLAESHTDLSRRFSKFLSVLMSVGVPLKKLDFREDFLLHDHNLGAVWSLMLHHLLLGDPKATYGAEVPRNGGGGSRSSMPRHDLTCSQVLR